MNKLLVVTVISIALLVILRTQGIQTDIVVLDEWVETVMGVFSI